ncbi:hypothetical protein RHMOL_Rhmol04G0317600 [Rhododendron molle]|uniref:Uncharacterized protein n=1 Tax=Rhododendron molle TaxID=49168 RepID=A0ACC0P8Y3_RHOML|nr:hypothetical protein RHMOL_Rhmol04G0317600 [Rhododendron molle]
MTEDVFRLESSFEDKLEMFASQDGLLQTEMCDPHNLTPLTPSFQFSAVSGIESKSSHPMVAALIDYAQTLSIEVKPERVEEIEDFRGERVHGKIDGKDVYVGNQKIALRARCATAPSIGHCGEGKSVGYVYLAEALAGIFSLSDSCRTGVREAINDLKSMNIKTVMLTGDSQEAAIEAQKQVKGQP